MKKFITFIVSLFVLINSIGVFSIYVEETAITLKPGLNSVSTPGLLKGISFSNGGDNIFFAILQNQKRKAINITNDNLGQTFSPLTGFIVRNDTLEDVTMNLSYETNIDEGIVLERNLEDGWNLLGTTDTNNLPDNISNTEVTQVLDLTDRGTNKITTGKPFQNATNFALGKAYGVFINSRDDGSGLYLGQNNNAKLNGFTESECIEICDADDESCPDICRNGILSNNTISNVTIYANDNSKTTVYDGTFTANKYLKIRNFTVYGDNEIPEGDELKLYLYVNNTETYKLTLNNENSYYGTVAGSETKVKTGNTIHIKVKAKYNGTSENVNYKYNFKLLGNDYNTIFYKINSQEISLNISGASDNPNIPDNPNPDNPINEAFQQAYNRANSKGILNNQIITYDNLNSGINNTELSIIMNNYTKGILNREIDTSKDCSFINTEQLTNNQFNAALESCQLGLIQNNDNIDLNNQSDLTSLSILLSRALWNDRYNGGDYLKVLQTAGIIKDISNPEYNELKGDILVALMNSEGKDKYRRVDNSYDFLMNDFNAVEDVYSNIRTSDLDRVIFIVRHSARENKCDEYGGLTDYGIELAYGVGEKLKGEPFTDSSSDFYGSSYSKRTVQTSHYVGKGRGNENQNNNILLSGDEWKDYSYVNHDNSNNGTAKLVNSSYFSDGSRFTSIENLYEDNKDLTNERARYAINRLCYITNGHPFSWITSHDRYTLPITEWATNGDISFSIENSDRPNFMQGVAIIVHEYGGREIYPIRSLDTGKIKTRENPGCNE